MEAFSEVIIVTGAEYAKYERAAGSTWILHWASPGLWRQVGLLWARRELKVPNTIVTLFDAATGTIERITPNGSSTRIAVLDTPTNGDFRLMRGTGSAATFHRPTPTLTSSGYPTLSCLYRARNVSKDPFVQADWITSWRGAPPLGMQTVYDLICQIGLKNPGGLRGLHVFSHAWAGGPILWNTRDFTGPGGRDPYDTDGRAHKDFGPTNLPSVENQRVEKIWSGDVTRTIEWWNRAWSNNVQAVVWGCLKSHLMATLIDGAIGQVGTSPQGNPNITYRWDSAAQWGGNSLEEWQKFFGVQPLQRSATVSLDKVRSVILRGNQDSYAFALRKAIGTLKDRPGSRVFFAPLGTSTMIDQPSAGPDMAMSVAGDRDKLAFLKAVGMPFTTDLGGPPPFGRGYTYF